MEKRLIHLLLAALFLLSSLLAGCGKSTPAFYTVSGRVTWNGAGLEGVTLAFSGSSSVKTTDFEGNWSMDGLSGTVTVTPSLTEYAFSPPSIIVSGARNDVNFTAIQTPSVPAGLTASGSLHNIHLAWSVSSGGNLQGYNIYRSADGVSYSQLNSTLVSGTTYDDTITSPDGDGVLYRYYVTAFGDAESASSEIVQSMHGTRLADSGSDLTLAGGSSPYVAEGTVDIDGGLEIPANTALYVLEGAAISFTNTAPKRLYVHGGGLLAAMGSQSSPVTITGTGGGVSLGLIGAAAGSRLEYAQFGGLASASSDRVCAMVSACSPTIINCRFDCDIISEPSINIYNSGANIEHCLFENIALNIQFGVESGLLIEDNIFLAGKPALMVGNISDSAKLIQAGQLHGNIFQCSGASASSYSVADVSLFNVTASGTIPLGGNYFYRGADYDTPLTSAGDFYAYISSGSPAVFGFADLLEARPTGAGPDWGTLPF